MFYLKNKRPFCFNTTWSQVGIIQEIFWNKLALFSVQTHSAKKSLLSKQTIKQTSCLKAECKRNQYIFLKGVQQN